MRTIETEKQKEKNRKTKREEQKNKKRRTEKQNVTYAGHPGQIRRNQN